MTKQLLIKSVLITAALTLVACSSDDDDDTPLTTSDGSMFNPNAPDAVDTGESGGDTTAISGLWNGTVTVDNVSDVVYWNIADNGVLTRYDYQQDGTATATGDNCYLVGDPISVSPESGTDYSFFNVAVTITRSGEMLTIGFNEADKNDVDNNGDVTELPTWSWTKLTTPVLDDLNACSS